MKQHYTQRPPVQPPPTPPTPPRPPVQPAPIPPTDLPEPTTSPSESPTALCKVGVNQELCPNVTIVSTEKIGAVCKGGLDKVNSIVSSTIRIR